MGIGWVFLAAAVVWCIQFCLAVTKIAGHLTLDWWLVLAPLWSPSAVALIGAATILALPRAPHRGRVPLRK